MKLSVQWLRDYVDLPADAQQLADLITSHVAEVEHVHSQAAAFDHMVVATITNITAHPNADKLRLCKVDLGDTTVQIVCGGSNLRVGQTVVVAKPGACVRWHGQGDLVTLAETTIRGEASFGMICAASEIGLEQLFPQRDDKEIVDLGDNAHPAGTPIAEALDFNDWIIEVDNKTLTHRPDLFCHLGFARELAVILKQPLKLPALPQAAPAERLPYQLRVEASSACRRYLGVVLDGITVQPSPAWLRQRLLAIGLRPINNVVDITNYVMVEYGQPLHAFDYDQLSGGQVVVRLAQPNETLITLDGNPRQLTERMLVIANDTKPVALAGIMGGQASEITVDTTTIALESANFEPTTIRLAAQALALRTDASTRHEKNLPLVFCELGMWRAIQLLTELAGASIASPLVDQRNYDQPRPTIPLELAYVQRLMGVAIASAEVERILVALGCTVNGQAGSWQVLPPTHRTDLLIAEELIEEVARLYGYSQITPQPLVAELVPQPVERTYQLGSQLVQRAVQAGAVEVLNYSFYSVATAQRFHWPLEQHATMLNPMNPNQALLRISLLPNLWLTVEANLDRGERDFTLVEYGHIYLQTEQVMLGLACAGADASVYRQLKGLLDYLGCPAASINLQPFGKWWAAAAEINLTELAKQPILNPQVQPPPAYPGIALDISVEFPKATAWSDIEPVIQQAGGPLLTNLTVFDVYQHALGIRLELQAADRTLTMDEAEQLRHTVIQALQHHFHATHRY